MKKRIVITGLGPIASVGIGKNLVWQGIKTRRLGLESIKFKVNNKKWEEFYMHRVKNFDLNNFNIDTQELNYIRMWKGNKENRDLNFLLAATKLALEDSGINYEYEKKSLGLVVAHENPCLEQLLWELFGESYNLRNQLFIKDKIKYFEKLYAKVVRTAYETQPFMFLFHIAKVFKIHQYSLYVNNACASGLYGLEAAKDMIVSGKSSQVVVVGGDCPDVFKYLWFKSLGMYSLDGKIRPFSGKGNGFVFGEGATALVVEDYNVANKRGAKIYAEYLGGSFQLEGWKITTPAIKENYLTDTLKNVLKRNRLGVSDIDLICAHGTGTYLSDVYEASAIGNVFRKSDKTLITALKPFVGHQLGGCTLIELAIILLSMQHKVILPILNIDKENCFRNLNLALEEKKVDYKTVLKTCSAFAGYNAAILLKKI